MPDVTVCKFELETPCMAGYQAALDDAYTNGIITAQQKGELLKSAMNVSIEFETRSFLARKSNNEQNR